MDKTTQTRVTLGATSLLSAVAVFTLTLTALGLLDSPVGRAYEVLLSGVMAVLCLAVLAAAVWETGAEDAPPFSGFVAAVIGNLVAFNAVLLGGLTVLPLVLALILHAPAAVGVALMFRGKPVHSPFSLLGLAWAVVMFGVVGLPQWIQSSGEGLFWATSWPLWVIPALLIVAGAYADAISRQDERHIADRQPAMS